MRFARAICPANSRSSAKSARVKYSSGAIGAGEAVEIMTGAPLPEGADAVVMIEHTQRNGARVRIDRTQQTGDNFGRAGPRRARATVVLEAGERARIRRDRACWRWWDGSAFRCIASLVWRSCPPAMRSSKPAKQPERFQIRNSNAWSLAAQVSRAGGMPEILPIARDNYESTRALIERGLDADLLLLSGGVSAGKYDIVETRAGGIGRRVLLRSREDSARAAVGVRIAREANNSSACRAIRRRPWSPSNCSRARRLNCSSGLSDAPLPLPAREADP